MLKFLAITFLIGYLVFKLFGMLFKFALKSSGAASQQYNSQQNSHQKRQTPDSNLNIDYMPDSEKKKDKKDFKGGEYVDFEEIK